MGQGAAWKARAAVGRNTKGMWRRMSAQPKQKADSLSGSAPPAGWQAAAAHRGDMAWGGSVARPGPPSHCRWCGLQQAGRRQDQHERAASVGAGPRTEGTGRAGGPAATGALQLEWSGSPSWKQVHPRLPAALPSRHSRAQQAQHHLLRPMACPGAGRRTGPTQSCPPQSAGGLLLPPRPPQRRRPAPPPADCGCGAAAAPCPPPPSPPAWSAAGLAGRGARVAGWRGTGGHVRSQLEACVRRQAPGEGPARTKASLLAQPPAASPPAHLLPPPRCRA